MPARPWSQRKLDVLYIAFFAVHALVTLLMFVLLLCALMSTEFSCVLVCRDTQHFVPTEYIPKALSSVKAQHVLSTNDPLLSKPYGHAAWFDVAVVLELVFQLPCYFLGAYALSKGL